MINKGVTTDKASGDGVINVSERERGRQELREVDQVEARLWGGGVKGGRCSGRGRDCEREIQREGGDGVWKVVGRRNRRKVE